MLPGKRWRTHRGVAHRQVAQSQVAQSQVAHRHNDTDVRRGRDGSRLLAGIAGTAAIVLVLSALILSGLFGRPAVAAGPEGAIRFAINDWTGQRISTRLMGAILTEAGFDVEYVEVNYMDQLDEIAAGRIDVAMEYWSIAGMAALDEAVSGGKARILGETGMVAREEWWFPAYAKEMCPGLPDWRALNGCAKIFAVPGTAPKGRYLGGPVTWGGFDEERVAALGLDFEVVHAATEADLYATLQTAVASRQPVLLWIYAPHWAPTRYDGDWVKFPAFTEACYADLRYDCGKPSGPIWKVGGADLPQRWPAAAQAVGAFRMSNEEMGALIARVEVDGVPIDAVVAEWMDGHERVWKSWLD